MDETDRRVKEIIGRELVRAYGYRPVEDPPACEHCGGDGCERCDWTGDPS